LGTRATARARRGDTERLCAPQLGWLAERAIPRFFTVPEPRQRELERLPYDLYSAELTIEPKHDRPAPGRHIDECSSWLRRRP